MCPSAGTTTPTISPAGYFAPQGTIEPTPCSSVSRTHYCPRGSSKPQRVSPGYYSARNATEQRRCEPGYFCEHGARIACPRGHYGAPDLDLRDSKLSCFRCPRHTTTFYEAATSVQACVCDYGYLSIAPDQGASHPARCEACPIGLVCHQRNTTPASLLLRPGHWRPSALAVQAVRCQYPINCAGGLVATTRFDPLSDATCNQDRGVHGSQCAFCHPGRFFNVVRRSCDSCSDGFMVTLTTLAIFFCGGVGVQVAMSRGHIRSQWRLWRRCVAAAREIELFKICKLLVSFYQIVTRMSEAYLIVYPPAYRQLEQLLDVVNLSVQWIPGLRFSCVGLHSVKSQLWFTILAPPLLIAVSLLGGWSMQMSVLQMLPSILPFLFLIFPTSASLGFRVLRPCWCVLDADGSHECFNTVDLSLRCPPPTGSWAATGDAFREYHTTVALANVVLGLYAFIVPIAFAASLFACRDSIRAGRPTPGSTALKFLHGEYKLEFLWWEMVSILGKLLLIGVYSLTPKPGSALQLAVGTVTALVLFAMLALAQPYHSRGLNVLANLCGASLVALFVVSIDMCSSAPHCDSSQADAVPWRTSSAE